MGGEVVRALYEAALAAALVAGLTVGATFAAAALITVQAMGMPSYGSRTNTPAEMRA